jgi:hypothetical protein
MKVSEILAAAWAEVGDANLPERIQPVAFSEAVRLMAEPTPAPQKESQAKKTAPSKGKSSARSADRTADQSDEVQVAPDDFFDAIAKETEVSVDDLEQVFFLDSGRPKVNLTSRSLGETMAARQKNIGLLICVARHFGLVEDETPASVVRDECARLRCADRNLSTRLGTLKGVVQSGDRTKVLKVRPPATPAFAELIEDLLRGDKAST